MPRQRIIPDKFTTLGKMVDEGVRVIAFCDACDLTLVVSPEMLAAYHGRDFSLVNLRPPCRRMGCTGRSIFLAWQGRFMPLLFD